METFASGDMSHCLKNHKPYSRSGMALVCEIYHERMGTNRVTWVRTQFQFWLQCLAKRRRFNSDSMFSRECVMKRPSLANLFLGLEAKAICKFILWTDFEHWVCALKLNDWIEVNLEQIFQGVADFDSKFWSKFVSHSQLCMSNPIQVQAAGVKLGQSAWYLNLNFELKMDPSIDVNSTPDLQAKSLAPRLKSYSNQMCNHTTSSYTKSKANQTGFNCVLYSSEELLVRTLVRS